MSDLDVFALAARQMELDREATKRFPGLLDHKRERLAVSPHAFLRGSAPLFYEILAAHPEIAAGPTGDGWIVGDMHLENVGAYRDDEGKVVFGLNDFDDASVGPLRCDVLRFSTSVLLASPDFLLTGAKGIALAQHAIASYLAARGGGAPPAMPPRVAELIQTVGSRTKQQLLDDRAPVKHGKRRFARGDRYLDLPPDVEARLPALLAAYVAALGARAPAKAGEWKIEDAAFRVAGTGSLGVLRAALLVRDDAGDERLLELKACRDPSTAALFQPPPACAAKWTHPALRCATAARSLCHDPPRYLAPLRVDELSFVGRTLFPQEDKLDLRTMHAGAKLDEVVGFIGYILGAAHARGVSALGGAASSLQSWTGDEVGAVVDHAVVLAGLFQGIYLAWCRRYA